MKKIKAIALILIMVLSLTSCSGGLSKGKYKVIGYKTENGEVTEYTDEIKDSWYIEVLEDGKGRICYHDDDSSSCTFDDSYITAYKGELKLIYTVNGDVISVKDNINGKSVEVLFEK